MATTTNTLEKYLGKSASEILEASPFKHWTYERSIENDLDAPLIDYKFPKNGLDFVCDEDDKVTTIFLYFDESRWFDENLLDVPPESTRQQVIERLGSPSKSGEGYTDPVLGEYGPWDRFTKTGYSIHVQYRSNADRVGVVTLMRQDVVT